MPTQLTGDGAGITAGQAITATAPADGDQATAASVVGPFQAILNTLKWLVDMFNRSNQWTAKQVFSVTSNLIVAAEFANPVGRAISVTSGHTQLATLSCAGDTSLRFVEARDVNVSVKLSSEAVESSKYSGPQVAKAFGRVTWSGGAPVLDASASAGVTAVAAAGGGLILQGIPGLRALGPRPVVSGCFGYSGGLKDYGFNYVASPNDGQANILISNGGSVIDFSTTSGDFYFTVFGNWI